jgi:hypothetical protein
MCSVNFVTLQSDDGGDSAAKEQGTRRTYEHR